MMREPGGLTMSNTYPVNSLSSRTPSQNQSTAFNYPEHARSPVVDEHPMVEMDGECKRAYGVKL